MNQSLHTRMYLSTCGNVFNGNASCLWAWTKSFAVWFELICHHNLCIAVEFMRKEINTFLTFPACFLIPIIFCNLNCSNSLDMRNLQEQGKKAICYEKIFSPFTVGQNNFGNKIPLLPKLFRRTVRKICSSDQEKLNLNRNWKKKYWDLETWRKS